MAGASIKIDIHGAESIQKTSNCIAHAGQDLREPLGDIGEHLLNTHRNRWELEQSPDGIPWEPLSEAYSEQKRRSRPAPGILVFDDLLEGTLRYQIRGNAL